MPRRKARLDEAGARNLAGALIEEIERMAGVGGLNADARALNGAQQLALDPGAGDWAAGRGQRRPLGVRVAFRTGTRQARSRTELDRYRRAIRLRRFVTGKHV